MPSKKIWRQNQSDDFFPQKNSQQNNKENLIQEIIKENNLKNLVFSFDVLSSASCFISEISWK